MHKFLKLAVVLLFPLSCFAEQGRVLASYQDEKGFPAPILMMDDFFSHHVLVAEKSTHLLHLFENEAGHPKYVRTYQMATGKKSGNKGEQGDHRTPEGAYFFTDFIPRDKLLKMYGPKDGEIYGVGAFVMDYPNPIDQRQGKGGGGIWLHSTNDETRIEKGLDSRGCVVTANNDLKDISQYIELNRTSIVVVQDLHFLKDNTWQLNRNKISEAIQKWLEAWKSEDLEAYMAFYHPIEFKDRKGGYAAYKEYKKAVFANPGRPEISLAHISVIVPGDYAVATFTQTYRSNSINDTGKKTLYLKRDENYDWKIASEGWSKLTADGMGEQVAFRPSMRFFNEATKGN